MSKAILPVIAAWHILNFCSYLMFHLSLLFTTRASEHAFLFAKKASVWGRLLSILWWVPKVFPKWSDYDLLREASMKYYNCIKVGFVAKKNQTLSIVIYMRKLQLFSHFVDYR